MASKISFTNFVKNITENIDLVSLPIILNAIGSDKRIGNNFLKPGGPFLGPCLPRDIVALTKFCYDNNVDTFYPNSAKIINKNSTNSLLDIINFLKKKKIKSIGFTGIAYKPNTDFYNESIAFKLMERAKRIGIKVYFFDRYIDNVKLNFTRTNSIKSLVNKADVIFLSYEDDYIFSKQKEFKKNILLWDIFNLTSLRGIKKFSNKKELKKLFEIRN